MSESNQASDATEISHLQPITSPRISSTNPYNNNLNETNNRSSQDLTLQQPISLITSMTNYNNYPNEIDHLSTNDIIQESCISPSTQPL
jgi:hypothetical protein